MKKKLAPAELKFAAAWIEELRASGEFTGKADELAVLHQPAGPGGEAPRGGGRRQTWFLDSAVLRKAVSTAVRTLKQKGVKTLAWWLASGDPEAAVEGAYSRQFRAGSLQNLRARPSRSKHFIVIAVRQRSRCWNKPSSAEEFWPNAQNFTRDLVNEPANLMTPMRLAERARAMAAESRPGM